MMATMMAAAMVSAVPTVMPAMAAMVSAVPTVMPAMPTVSTMVPAVTSMMRMSEAGVESARIKAGRIPVVANRSIETN